MANRRYAAQEIAAINAKAKAQIAKVQAKQRVEDAQAKVKGKKARKKRPRGYVWGDFNANEVDAKDKTKGLGPEW